MQFFSIGPKYVHTLGRKYFFRWWGLKKYDILKREGFIGIIQIRSDPYHLARSGSWFHEKVDGSGTERNRVAKKIVINSDKNRPKLQEYHIKKKSLV